MNKIKKILIVVGTLVTIYLLLQLKACRGKTILEYWQDSNFKTDTFIVKEPYTIKGDSFPYKVPPKVVIKYLPQDDKGMKVKCLTDSLLSVIDSLGKEITSINKRFLTLFPKSNKLIYGRFKSDTIQLDVLKKDGDIFSEIYLTNYSKFEYEYRENQFRAKEITRQKPPELSNREKLSHSLYVSGGCQIFGKYPTISADYYLRYKKFQLAIEPVLTLQSDPGLMLYTKLGYKLK